MRGDSREFPCSFRAKEDNTLGQGRTDRLSVGLIAAFTKGVDSHHAHCLICVIHGPCLGFGGAEAGGCSRETNMGLLGLDGVLFDRSRSGERRTVGFEEGTDDGPRDRSERFERLTRVGTLSQRSAMV